MNADEPIHDDDSWKTITVKWAFQQSLPTILLVAILVSIWYGGTYVVKEAVPAHLESIKAGYREIESSHREERENRLKLINEEREKDRQERQKDRELMREILFQSIKKPTTSMTLPNFDDYRKE